ncbi:hypothetical protein [Actinoallomurus sp. NPDC050550]|uniref:hypothetical protein n=1 Tax=Actinoallomurus sp. NPDC050550 TaxID=3154937 RepID=UPI0033F58F0B
MLKLAQRMITGTLASVAVLGTVAAVAPAADAAVKPKCTTVTKTVPVPKYADPQWEIRVCVSTEKIDKDETVIARIEPMMRARGTSKKGFAFKYPTNAAVLHISLTLDGKKQAAETYGIGQYVKRYLWTKNRPYPLILSGISASAVRRPGTWQAIGRLDYDVSNDKRGAYRYTVKSPVLR